MDRDELIRKLMGTFLAELEEHVQALNRDLMALEDSPEPEDKAERIKVLFRTAHSLKGAARSVNVGPVERACHRLEELFALVRDGETELSAEKFELLFAAVDAIQKTGNRLKEGGSPEDLPLVDLLPRLDAAVWQNVPLPDPDGGAPSSSETSGARGTTAAAETAELAEIDPPDHPPSAIEEGIVRIDAGKLDSLVSAASELLVVRSRAAHRQAEAAALLETVREWRAKWPILQKALANSTRQDRSTGEDRSLRPAPTARRLANALNGANDSMRKLLHGLDQLAKNLSSDDKALDQVAVPLETGIRDLRMIRFEEACIGLNRVVRDLSKTASKKVKLAVSGGKVELDRAILQELGGPLLHLIRNAVDHGIEPPSERAAAGKPKTGQISVSATLRGGKVEIIVADDGRGIDLEAIRRQLKKKNVPVPEEEQALTEAVFLPGVSTARLITEVSGRGVGLDVVRSAVESVRGMVRISSQPKLGTQFCMTLPLTVTTLRALLIRVNRQVFALDAATIGGLRRIEPTQIRTMEGREVLPMNGAAVPIVSLGGILGLGESAELRPGEKLPVVVLDIGGESAVFTVDELLAEREIVVKALGNRVKRLSCVDGATILPNGEIALILRAQSLVRSALGHVSPYPLSRSRSEEREQKRKRLLLVEDSVTTRTLEANILDAAGYEVVIAADGAEAWQLLRERGADLVVSDIEMPKMDGFALTEAIRSSKRFRDLPVVLVTALATDVDKARGMDAGANAYLLKSTFDQRELLSTIEQLL